MRPQAVIFDMDGVLIDSEPFWQQVEFAVFQELGVPLSLADCQQTIGMRCDNVVQYWFDRHPWQGPSPAQVVEHIVAQMADILCQQGELPPDVKATLAWLHERQIPVALATSSHQRIMDAIVDHFGLRPYFRHCQSAEQLRYAKPHPEVYLLAAQALAIAPEYCLAIEDSVTGMIAAKAARMQCAVIPDRHFAKDPRFALADQHFTSMSELYRAWQQQWQ